LFLAICIGDDQRAETLYKAIAYPSRWWANVTYAQGHYLLRLRRRDRLLHLVWQLGLALALPDGTDDPWADLGGIADALESLLREQAGEPQNLSVMYCVLGHARLAMDYHEAANAVYRRSLALDAAVSVPWENMSLLGFLREEFGIVPATGMNDTSNAN